MFVATGLPEGRHGGWWGLLTTWTEEEAQEGARQRNLPLARDYWPFLPGLMGDDVDSACRRRAWPVMSRFWLVFGWRLAGVWLL